MLIIKTIQARTHGRYLVEAPGSDVPLPVLIGFHGYGENAERHLADLLRIPGTERMIVVAAQGLHWFYNMKTNDVVANWMTRLDRDLAINDNVRYVRSILDVVRADHKVDGRIVFLGFSQGVPMAFRTATLADVEGLGVIGLGGDIPAELGEGLGKIPAVLLARGKADEWYSEEKIAGDVQLLERAGVRVETCTFEGGHEWGDEFRAAAGDFLRRLLS
ncbi:MAG TPA: phospholipase [Thermoanaerobaculia bacterium]|nr:phospholipase [Thermoanaerobaculia bacterium]